MQEVELKPKDVAVYVALPGVFPRLKRLFGGLSYLPFFLAILYRNLGLIPASHPYLQPENAQRFGIVSLVSAAANELVFDKRHIDKTILFGATIIGLVVFALFGIGFVWSFLSHGVQAASIIVTPSPATDIAFTLLDRIFGIPGVFGSAFSTVAPFPSPFQTGLHSLIEFYNTALFIIAAFIFLYYIVSIVAETAITGSLFGQRFHKIWGPLRLVLALGLLLPMGTYGLNSAQYILLYVAKFGSSVATNAWLAYNATPGLASPFAVTANTTWTAPSYDYVDVNGATTAWSTGVSYQSNGMMAHPRAPDVSGLMAYANLIHTCIYAYKQIYNYDIQPYFVRTTAGASIAQPAFSAPGVVSYTDATTFYGEAEDIYIYFGHQSITDNPGLAGNVKPYCGELVFPHTNLTIDSLEANLGQLYYFVVMQLFAQNNPLVLSGVPAIARSQAFGYKVVANKLENKAHPAISAANPIRPCGLGYTYTGLGNCNDSTILPNHRAFSTAEFTRAFNSVIDSSIAAVMGQVPSPFSPTANDLNMGWATAGIWYTRLAQWNGDVVIATTAIPRPGRFPEVMEKVKSRKLVENPNTSFGQIFQAQIDGQRNVELLGNEREIHGALMRAYDYWNAPSNDRNTASTGNLFEGGMAAIFGLTPILTIREQTNVHPLAKLSAIGRNLIENAITNLTLAFGASFMGGVMGEAGNSLATTFAGASGFFTSLAFIGIQLGVVLYYIMPFMPFLYGFFAVGGWIKSIFEAMVGVPLWALAHLKLKGDGLLSRESISGYMLLLEIFIRPTLILFGLVASTAIFAASITVLNLIWDVVTDNITGVSIENAAANNPLTMGYYRNAVDQLFFLVMYIIVVYLIGNSVFKLVDQIPHSVTRWMNGSVKSFGDMAKDPAEGLAQYGSMAVYRFGPKLGEAVEGVGGMAGAAAGKAGLSEMFRPTEAAAATGEPSQGMGATGTANSGVASGSGAGASSGTSSSGISDTTELKNSTDGDKQ